MSIELKELPLEMGLRILQMYDRREKGLNPHYSYQDAVNVIEGGSLRETIDRFVMWEDSREGVYVWSHAARGDFKHFYHYWEGRGRIFEYL